MAYLEQTTDEERRQLEESGGGGAGPASSPGGGAAAPPTAAPSSGFQNLANYFSANKDAAEAQGAATADALQKEAVGAIYSDDPGKAADAYGNIDAAARPDTLASVNQGNRSAGEARLDAYLSTRGAAPGQFQQLRETFGAPLLRVEAPYSGPEVQPLAPFAAQSDEALRGAVDASRLGTGSNLYRLAQDTITKNAQQERDRYAAEMQPQRDYEARRVSNREPFKDLYELYYGKGKG